MESRRHLIDYLPPYVQEYTEMIHIMSAEQVEIDELYAACEDALSDQFIVYATRNGISRWETIMRITPKDTDSLETRRFRLLTKMSQELPYTVRKLEESLTTLCGAGNFEINLQPANYHIEIKLALKRKNDYQEVIDLLKKMIPANLTQWVQIMYNSGEVLGQFTHAELANYTHEQLRNEVL